MANEFKKISSTEETRYVLESGDGGGTSAGSIASVEMPMGVTQKRAGQVVTQEADKPNPVAKAAKKVAKGAGRHKNPKDALTQPRKEKHKKDSYSESLEQALAAITGQQGMAEDTTENNSIDKIYQKYIDNGALKNSRAQKIHKEAEKYAGPMGEEAVRFYFVQRVYFDMSPGRAQVLTATRYGRFNTPSVAEEMDIPPDGTPEYDQYINRGQKTPFDLGGADAYYGRQHDITKEYGFQKGSPEWDEYIQGYRDTYQNSDMRKDYGSRTSAVHPRRITKTSESALSDFRKEADKRKITHDKIEADRKANAAAGKEPDVKSAVDRLDAQINAKEEIDHEGDTVKNSLHTIIRVATHLEKNISDEEQFPEWVSEKVGAIHSMMVTVMNYVISDHEQKDGDRLDQGPKKEDHSTATGGWGQGSMNAAYKSSALAGAGHDDRTMESDDYFNKLKETLEAAVDERSKSQAQWNLMHAVAHNPAFAKKVGVKQSVGKEFSAADAGHSPKSLPKRVVPKKKK